MKRNGAAGLTTVLGVVAVVVTAGFLFWLYQRANSLEQDVEPVMADTAEVDGPAPLALDELAADPEAAVGRRAALDGAEVSSSLGRGAFVLQLDETRGYPVLLSRDLIQRDLQLYGGDVVSVWGQVYMLNDSIRGAWVDAGAVNEGQRGAIPSSASFVLADSLVIR